MYFTLQHVPHSTPLSTNAECRDSLSTVTVLPDTINVGYNEML